MFDHHFSVDAAVAAKPAVGLKRPAAGGSLFFWATKRAFDIALDLALMVLFVPLVAVLWVMNPFLNKGPLFFSQVRMGRDCRPFRAYKFRSMHHVSEISRGADDPLEIDRITPLGRIIRRCRIDELPQIINVLRGDMSLIGPRPDYFEHARVFLETVPGYRARHAIRPGISGLAQIEVGYVAGADATRKKVAADLYYIQNAGWRLESALILKTIATVLFFRAMPKSW